MKVSLLLWIYLMKEWEETLISSHFIEYFISISYIKLAMNSFMAGSQLHASW